MKPLLQERVIDYVEARRDRLVALIGDLVRRPSENMPPNGAEVQCQRYVASVLQAAGLEPDIYELDAVPGFAAHPLFAPGRIYRDRPNVVARMSGGGRGRSLILSGHIDTVPRGTLPWTRSPFGAQVEGDRLYGRGANDMKAGVAMNLFVMEAARELKLQPAGDLLFESVVDEEFGGVNGTLAGRLHGDVADAAIITEPSSLRICPAQRGGRTAHITFSSRGGVLDGGGARGRVMDQVTIFLRELDRFAEQRRRNCRRHSLYSALADPVPVAITKLTTGPWGTGEPVTLPEECRVEMYWQLMPGEEQQEIDREFHAWFESMIAAAPEIFLRRPTVEYPIRWLPGSAIEASEPIVTELSDCAARVLPAPPLVAGIEGPCDLFVFHAFHIPAVLWGPRGGNTHGSDEYVELDSVVAATKALLLFVCRWCGMEDRR